MYATQSWELDELKKGGILVPGIMMEPMVSMVTTFSNGNKLVGIRIGWLKFFS